MVLLAWSELASITLRIRCCDFDLFGLRRATICGQGWTGKMQISVAVPNVCKNDLA